jgi:hypothetical protein
MVNNICNKCLLLFEDVEAQYLVLSSSTIGRQICTLWSDPMCQISGPPGSKVLWPALAQTSTDHTEI